MGDQASSIDNLSKDISKEDMDLVNSILNDISNNGEMPQVAQSHQSEQMPSTDISKEEMIQRQRMLEQAQQQASQPIVQSNNISSDMPYVNSMQKSTIDTIIDKVKIEYKSILLVIVLAIVFSLEQVKGILSYYPAAFIEDTTTLSTQGILIKSLIIGLFYFIIKSQIF